jgi:hypothetical protein
MPFFKQLPPLSQCGNHCMCCMAAFIMIFSIVTFSSTFWLVGYWDCVGNSAYFYIQLAQYCYDNSGNTNDDFISCSAWTTIADDTSGSESSDAMAYHNGHGLAVTAFVFGFFCNVSLLLGLYGLSDPDLKNKVRYLTALLAAIAGFFLFVVIAQDSSSWFTDVENNSFYYNTCSSNMSVPSGGYVGAFMGVAFAVAVAAGLMFPSCGCAGADSEMEANLMGNSASSSYPQQGATGMQQPQVVYVVQAPGQPMQGQHAAPVAYGEPAPYEAKNMA